jgi:uncharacterized membrane protein
LELVVFAASLKFFFIEGGEQFIVGAQTAKTIGLKSTLKITLAGVSFAVILFFLLFYSHALIPTRWLEFALAITLYFFAATMFKEVFEKESDNDEAKQLDEKAHKYGYITIVSLESVENATVLAALTFIDISGALIGAFISISTYVVLAINSKRFLTRIPLKKLRLIAAILLTITATPLIIYSFAIHTPDWLHWIIPPLH